MMNTVSIDGFFAGPNGELDWPIRDPEVEKALHGSGAGGTALFGRVTYQLFESVWPRMGADPNAPEEARRTARQLDEMTKVVFSHTLDKVTWVNSQLVKGDLVQEVKKLKQGNGLSMIIFGSGTIVQQLTAAGLIDDYLFIVTPVVLGAGKSMFAGVKRNLVLVDTKAFSSGNVILHYKA